jgi:hypothetical protein
MIRRYQRGLFQPDRPQEVFGSIHRTCLFGLNHRLADGNVVSFLHCMNDPQPEGSHMATFIGRRKFLATLGGAAAWPQNSAPSLDGLRLTDAERSRPY